MSMKEMACLHVEGGIILLRHITTIRKNEEGKTEIRMSCGLVVIVHDSTVAQVMEVIAQELMS